MKTDLLVAPRDAALPADYAVHVTSGGFKVAVRGAPQLASDPDGTAIVVGDPVLRRGTASAVGAEFLKAVAERREEDFLRERVLGHFALGHATREGIRVFASAAGLHHFFFDPRGAASTSLRTLAGLARRDFDPVAVHQFLSAGYTFGRRTPFRDVERLMGGEAIAIEGAGWRRYRWRPLRFVDRPVSSAWLREHVRSAFAGCAESLAAVPVCADVTGGFDTRLVVALLHHLRVPFVGFVSGPDDHPDVTLAREIARRLEFPLTQVDVERAGEGARAYALERFDEQDFLKPFPAWLDMMFANELGCGPARFGLTGHGGEQFRDFAWQQEFPFYGLRRRPDLDLQIRLRFMATRVDSALFAPAIGSTIAAESHRLLRADMAAFIDEIDPPDNLAASLALYLAFREGSRVGGSSTEKRRSFRNWAPLLEPELWLAARTPWWSRLGAGHSLELAEALAPELAGIPTAAMSDGASGLAAVFATMRHYARRATAKLAQKMSNRPYASGRARSLSVFEDLIRMPRFRDLVLAAIEPCGFDPARVEAMLDRPDAPGHAEILGAILPLGGLAIERTRVEPES
jgi:hypothetical protein